MKDRQPTRPGRVKITPENGAAYYAVMEMADEPTEVGTPPTKANLLKDSTAALLGGNADMVPDDALVALKNLIDNLSPESLGAAQVEAGTYVGANADSKTIALAGRPQILFVAQASYSPLLQSSYGITAFRHITQFSHSEANNYTYFDFGENSVTITGKGTSTSQNYQNAMNTSGKTYYYYAICS